MGLIDRKELKKTIMKMVEFPDDVRVKVIAAINRAKPVDAVPVVRCKDCKWWLHKEDGCGDCSNPRFHLDGYADPTMEMGEFCCLGERR